MKLAIGQNELLRILMQVTTREDLAKSEKKTEEQFSKVDARFEKVEIKLKQLEQKMVSREEFVKFEKATEALFAKIDLRFYQLEQKFDKFFYFIIASMLMPMITSFVLHFVK